MAGACEPKRVNETEKPANFDRLAPLYRWMEWCSFGPFLGRCRCAFLPELKNCRSALVLGDGDGRFTARLLRENPHARVDAVDASAAMLRALNKRAASSDRGTESSDRVRTFCADARKWRPVEANYDLIATHFFLDCLTTDEVCALAAKVRGAAAQDAVWVVSEFAEPETRFGRLVARPVVGLLYWAFGWMTGLRVRRLPVHGAALRAAGFALQQRKGWLGGMLVSEMWAAPGGPALALHCSQHINSEGNLF